MHERLASAEVRIPPQATPSVDSMDATEYEVETRDGRTPVLVRIGRSSAELHGDRTVGAPCYRAVHGRATPCEGCPIGANAAPGSTFHAAPIPGDDERYAKRRIERISAGRYRVVSTQEPGNAVSALVRARVERAFGRARLTGRERSVVDCLLLGRSVDDIAKVLSLSPHTVKFHKVNALKKLGADSSLDLLRIFVS